MEASVQVRTLAHGRPKTLLVILIGGVFALIGGCGSSACGVRERWVTGIGPG